MKKILSILLAITMTLSLVACGDTDTGESSSADNSGTARTEIKRKYDNPVHQRKIPKPAEDFAGGDGSEENPWQISTAEELYRFAWVMEMGNFDIGDEHYTTNFDDMYYVLTDDIVLNDVSDYDNWATNPPENGWEPVSSFEGQLDGAGHTITGLYCYAPSEKGYNHTAALFGSIWDAVVKNLNLEKCMIISSNEGKAAIADDAYGSVIQNCHVNGTILTDNLNAGGIASRASYSVIENCTFTGKIEGNSDIGGIVGRATGSLIDNCTVSGSMSGESDIGGIVNSFSSFNNITNDNAPWEKSPYAWQQLMDRSIGIKNCTNTADITCAECIAGGILGSGSTSPSSKDNSAKYWTPVEIVNCTNSGKITAKSLLGSGTGGICGEIWTSHVTLDSQLMEETWNIRNCHNSGEITSTDNNAAAGGILGHALMYHGTVAVTDSSNSGQVSTGEQASLGGILGAVTIYESCDIILEGLKNTVDFVAQPHSNVGGILGNVVIAANDLKDSSFILRDCISSSNITETDPESSRVGGICGMFMKGLEADDWQGELVIENCIHNENLPAMGSYTSVLETREKLVEGLYAEGLSKEEIAEALALS